MFQVFSSATDGDEFVPEPIKIKAVTKPKKVAFKEEEEYKDKEEQSVSDLGYKDQDEDKEEQSVNDLGYKDQDEDKEEQSVNDLGYKDQDEDKEEQSVDDFINETRNLISSIEAELDESYAIHAKLEKEMKESDELDPSVVEYFQNLKV